MVLIKNFCQEYSAYYMDRYLDNKQEIQDEIYELEKEVDVIFKNNPIYARGTVFHSGREHRALRLGDEWFEVYRNTEIRSWSVNGSFD